LLLAERCDRNTVTAPISGTKPGHHNFQPVRPNDAIQEGSYRLLVFGIF
jgi:hypothetical protein